MAKTYSTGTLKVTAGQRVVTLTGGSAASYNMKAGDLIKAGDGSLNVIESTNTQIVPHTITMGVPFDGTDSDAAVYFVTHMPAGWSDIISLNEHIAEEIRAIGTGILTMDQLATALAQAEAAVEATTEVLAAAHAATEARDEAEAAKVDATAQAVLATAANTNAQVARTASETARNKARDWADKDEDSTVEFGAYSSKHHARKAEASATEAATSHSGADTALAGAEAARDKSEAWADTVPDTAVEPGKFSAKHHAQRAEYAATVAQEQVPLAVAARAGAEDAQEASETARGGAQASQSAAEDAQDGAETARTGAETARTGAEAAQGLSEAARDAAEGYSTSAGLSAGTATTKATEADAHRADAEAAKTLAQDWADKNENSPVAAGQFSSKHHAIKAAGSAAASEVSRLASEAAKGQSEQFAADALESKNQAEAAVAAIDEDALISTAAAQRAEEQAIRAEAAAEAAEASNPALYLVKARNGSDVEDKPLFLQNIGAAPSDSPTFTGDVNVPTPSAEDNSTKAATTAFVQAALSALIGSAPGALDTLNELAEALGNDPDFAATTMAQIATKLATADFTGAAILLRLLDVDGAASGLDADMLDGHHADEFMPRLAAEPGSTPGTRRYMRIATIDGVDALTGGAMSLLIGGQGDYGAIARGTTLVHFGEKDGEASAQVYQFGFEGAVGATTFHLRQVSDHVWELWGHFAEQNRAVEAYQIAGFNGLLQMDGATGVAPAGITQDGVVQSDVFHSGNTNAFTTAEKNKLAGTVVADVVSQEEAELGVSTTTRHWNALRIRQAIAYYAPAKAHTHTIAHIDTLQDVLDSIAAAIGGKADLVHTHEITNITGLQALLAQLRLDVDAKQVAGNYEPSREEVEQSAAEAGTETTIRGWSALRVRQAINAVVDALGIPAALADRVGYSAQTPTDGQKAIARTNIGAAIDAKTMAFRETLGGASDLDTLVVGGFYTQDTDANAATGENYPVPLAGMLEVVEGAAGVVQRYTSYSSDLPRTYIRCLLVADSEWSAWHNSSAPTISTDAPTGGYDGDVWHQVS